MNRFSVEVVSVSRTVFGAGLLLLASCASPAGKVSVAEPGVFDLSPAELRARYPQVQKIGVVELSGSRIKARAFPGGTNEVEYLASGGAMLVKQLQSPIQAHAPEILVTPEAAVLKGRQAIVRQDGRVITGEGDGTRITIDGAQVKIEGPHSIRNLATGKVSLMAGAQGAAAEEAAPDKPAEPEIEAAPKVKTLPKRVKKTEALAPAVMSPKPRPSPAPVVAVAPTPKSPAPAKSAPPKAAVKPAAKPTPKPAVKPAPKADRKELLNLMREPSE